MIKYLLFLIIIVNIYADNTQVASTILKTIASDMTEKENPKIFIYSAEIPYEIDRSSLNLVNNCSDADFIIVNSAKEFPQECSQKILFGTKYSNLQNKQVLGAFFWQKGRPNILFYKIRLEKKHISLEKTFSKYIE